MNLRTEIGRVVYPIPVSSLEQLRVECVEAERHFCRREPRIVQTPQRNYVNEVDFSNVEYDEDLSNGGYGQVEELNTIMTCWNCKQPGHGFVDCPSEQRKLFCYKCDKPEVISVNCPNFKSKGNSHRGAITTGELRPTKVTLKQQQ